MPEPDLPSKEPPGNADSEDLYRRLGRELWALFYAQCSDADRAFDALQESFLRWHQHRRDRTTPIQDARAWLLQVGRNWLRDVARREKVAARPSEHLDDLAGTRTDALDDLLDRETRELVRAGLEQLRAEDREVLVLRYALGWSSLRIAEVLGSNAAAIDMRLSRARRRLADLLSDLGLDHDE